MGKYGEVANMAAQLLINNKVDTPIEAWEISVKKYFQIVSLHK